MTLHTPRLPGNPTRKRKPAAPTLAYAVRELSRTAKPHFAITDLNNLGAKFGFANALERYLASPRGSNKEKLLRAPLADGSLRRWATKHGLGEMVDTAMAGRSAGKP